MSSFRQTPVLPSKPLGHELRSGVFGRLKRALVLRSVITDDIVKAQGGAVSTGTIPWTFE